jgi:hypothetical protein
MSVTRYSLVFDWWSEASMHFVGLYILYPWKEQRCGFETHLLSFLLLPDETKFKAQNHADFIASTLQFYSLPEDRLFFLIEDFCSTNKAAADILKVPLFGCHCFNLATEAYLRKFVSPELEKAESLMTKLSTLKQGGRFRLMTSLRPVKRSVTRWTRVSEMFDRLKRLLPSCKMLTRR